MRFTYRQNMPTSRASEMWQAARGDWTFVIAHNKNRQPDEGYFTTYRKKGPPMSFDPVKAWAVFFHGDDELRGVKECPLSFAHPTLAEAQRACEAKFHQLRRAGNA